MEKTVLNVSLPAFDLQSAGRNSNSSFIKLALLAEALSHPGENTASVTEALLSSALDTSFGDKPLAGMVLVPETVVGIEEDMQALLSLMAVEVSAPVIQTEQEFGDAHHQDEGPMPADNPALTAEVTQVVGTAEINRESDAIDNIAAKAAVSTPWISAR